MANLKSLLSRGDALATGAAQVRVLEALQGPRFDERIAAAGLGRLSAAGLGVLQINVGKVCNQTCRHCHVDAGPDRRESMSRENVDLCLSVLERTNIPTVDVTGGAPELHPEFRRIVQEARGLGRHVLDRCNLTVLLLQGQADLVDFLAEHQVEVIASLPSLQAAQTDAQRGDGIFERSIEALQRLNARGYGVTGSELSLHLVHNPVGAFLPSPQAETEARFKGELSRRHGITFNRLYSITNMPISRYLEWLRTTGNLETYVERLISAFNPAAVSGVMCRTTLSVGWDGTLYDCDFNQMLDLPTGPGAPRHIRDFDAIALAARTIVTGRHCFGCTAGAGSSCGGTTV